jgi:hypothetical protein
LVPLPEVDVELDPSSNSLPLVLGFFGDFHNGVFLEGILPATIKI